MQRNLIYRRFLSSKVGSDFFQKASRDWETAWKLNLTPWDLKGTITPPLEELFQGKAASLISRGSALVPGCGSGYDCFFLRNVGFNHVLGLDLSSTAIQVAKEASLKQQILVEFEAANFFQYKFQYQYDFIFDYLFFAALDPKDRVQWAEAMKRALDTERGILATLIFPLKSRSSSSSDINDNNGPPYPVDLEDYHSVLLPSDWQLLQLHEKVTSVKPRQGREMLALWKRRKQQRE